MPGKNTTDSYEDNDEIIDNRQIDTNTVHKKSHMFSQTN